MVKKRNRGTTKGEESVPKEGVMMALRILQLDFQAIKAATGNFSDSNKLGKGGFGAVYKGMLPDGQEIAVKRLFSANYENEDSVFANEAMLLAKLRHKNLVSLIGYCCEGPERILIFELMSNSSLDHFIFGHADHAPLDWERRYAIITGIARGLLYLHEDSPEQIVHLDIKAANILLDAEMNPKIADFGLARLFGLDKTHTYATKVAGTRGYMAPEYLLENIVSVKADVFSFGVLILEIVSGRRVHTEEGSLLSHAWNKWREGTEQEIIDPDLSSTSMSEIRTCIHVGLLCVQEDRNDRPMMGSVVSMLYRRAPPLQMPSKPGYVQLQPTHDLPWNTVPKAQPKRLMRSASANDGRGVTS